MIRITGIVKTANQVRTQLQQGVSPQEVDSLKAFVANSLKTIEKICREANTKPYYLPTPSRKAYYYLKTIDWHNLPIANQESKLFEGKISGRFSAELPWELRTSFLASPGEQSR